MGQQHNYYRLLIGGDATTNHVECCGLITIFATGELERTKKNYGAF